MAQLKIKRAAKKGAICHKESARSRNIPIIKGKIKIRLKKILKKDL
jgi:hypothetical protein